MDAVQASATEVCEMTQTIEQLTARVRELEEEKKELQAMLDFEITLP